MTQIEVKNTAGERVGQMELDDAVFGEEMNEHLLWEVVKWQRAKRRRGTHKTKTRGEVRATNRKPYKQKGTGRARAGDAKSPIWVGGGTAFGPRPRDYSYNMPKKARKKALRSVLSQRLRENKLIVVDDFRVEGGKTKNVVSALAALGAPQPTEKTLIVDGKDNQLLVRSTANLPRSKWLAPEGLNVYDVLHYTTLVVAKNTLEGITAALRP